MTDATKPFDLEEAYEALRGAGSEPGATDCACALAGACGEIVRLRARLAMQDEHNRAINALLNKRNIELARCVTEVGEWGARCGELRIERDSWRHAFDVLYGTLRRFANEGSSVNYQARKALNHPSVQAVLDVPAVERGGAFMSAENRALDAEARVKALTEALEKITTHESYQAFYIARAALAADKETEPCG